MPLPFFSLVLALSFDLPAKADSSTWKPGQSGEWAVWLSCFGHIFHSGLSNLRGLHVEGAGMHLYQP